MKGADGTRMRCDPWTSSSAHPKGLVPRGGAVCPPRTGSPRAQRLWQGLGGGRKLLPRRTPPVSSAGPPPSQTAAACGESGWSPGPESRSAGERGAAHHPPPCAARPSPGGVRATRPTRPTPRTCRDRRAAQGFECAAGVGSAPRTRGSRPAPLPAARVSARLPALGRGAPSFPSPTLPARLLRSPSLPSQLCSGQRGELGGSSREVP